MKRSDWVPAVGDIVTNKSSVAMFRVIEITEEYVRARKVFSLSKKRGGVYRISKLGLRKFVVTDLHEMSNSLIALVAGERNRETR